jgi:hypothetical protein
MNNRIEHHFASSVENSEHKVTTDSNSYILYFLQDPISAVLLRAAQDILTTGNVILAYPKSADSMTSSGHIWYCACFLVNGKYLIEQKKIEEHRKIKEVMLGRYNLSILDSLPGAPMYKHLIKIALWRARIGIQLPFLLPSLLKLPFALIEHGILPLMDAQTLSCFSQTSYRSAELAKEKLGALKLPTYVVRGEHAKVDAILKQSALILARLEPLLRTKYVVTDYSGRIIEGTLFQLALGAEDTWKGCMAELIERYLLLLPNGSKIMAEQHQAQFPSGWYQKKASQVQKDLEALHKVFQAIIEAKPEDDSYPALEQACEPALEEFRNHFKPTPVIRAGKHCNIELLIKAIELLRTPRSQFLENMQRLFSCKVIGFIQRYLSTGWTLVKKKNGVVMQPLAFFPLSQHPELGNSCAINYDGFACSKIKYGHRKVHQDMLEDCLRESEGGQLLNP